MNRYTYYLITVTMITNTVSTVPNILLNNTKNGAIFSMVIGGIVGLLMIYISMLFFNHFPGQGLPELMKEYTPKWFHYPILIYFVIMWYLAGTLTLVTFTFMLVTFLSPEMTILTMITPFLIIISYGVLMKTKNVLYSTEIIFLLIFPIILYSYIKAYGSSTLNWDYVKLAVMHANKLPTYDVVTASAFIFTGVVNLAIFNRYFLRKEVFGAKQVVIIGLTSFFILFTTYFIPIGFGGFENVDNLLYPWISTTDSIRIKFGLIERLVFMFMFYFVSIAILSMIIHWHVAAQLLESVVYFKNLKWKETNLTPHIIGLCFTLVAIVLSLQMTEHQLFEFARFIYNIVPIFFFVFLFTMWLIKRGATK
ncbi:GerAB/ArcD/ProY family transporter [Sporosarcina siberiensis]|uniref:GerAB/ArcD/ProY family transporter n=1 Tax=Sporosarcina siberiensis TaxID=1365606 RepID=A0ABW4SFY1_9BACL